MNKLAASSRQVLNLRKEIQTAKHWLLFVPELDAFEEVALPSFEVPLLFVSRADLARLTWFFAVQKRIPSDSSRIVLRLSHPSGLACASYQSGH